MNETPTEHEESRTLAAWLAFNNYKFSKINQETYTPYKSQHLKAKYEGVNRGVPDYLIILPDNKGLLFLELKRKKGGVVSPEQQDWITELSAIPNVEAIVCKGADEAIKFITDLIS